MRKKTANPKGSILIMTFVMGLSLTAVFFAFSQNLTLNARTQKKSMNKQSSELLLESYVDYIQGLGLADLNTLKGLDGVISFGGITGTLTNEVDEIVGKVDALGESGEYHFADTVKIEWNLCADNNKTDLTVSDTNANPPYSHVGSPPPECSSGTVGYDDLEPTLTVANPFKIKSTAAPFEYRITSTTANKAVLDNKWYLDLEIELGFRKKITVNRIFTPGP